MRAKHLERVGIILAILGGVGFVAAAGLVSIVLGIVVASTLLVGSGALVVVVAVRTDPSASESKAGEGER